MYKKNSCKENNDYAVYLKDKTHAYNSLGDILVMLSYQN